MRKSRLILTLAAISVLVGGLSLLPQLHSQEAARQRQPGAVYDFDFPNEQRYPPPVRDIHGIWEPASGPGGGINANGAQQYPSTGRPEHELPYTPEGRAAFLANKPTFGITMVPSALTNDPMPGCDPQGFPRVTLHNFRTMRVLQSPENMTVLYLFNRKWRVIWTDGRELPKVDEVEEPRFWGYSTGKWEDDYTFVAETVGLDTRTWLDNAGRPHSDALRVIERFKRIDREHLELTIIIDDPKYYTKPWTAMVLRMRRQSPSFDIREMECVPSETAKYNQLFANPAAGIEEEAEPGP